LGPGFFMYKWRRAAEAKRRQNSELLTQVENASR
jgi:hypothetical protein